MLPGHVAETEGVGRSVSHHGDEDDGGPGFSSFSVMFGVEESGLGVKIDEAKRKCAYGQTDDHDRDGEQEYAAPADAVDEVEGEEGEEEIGEGDGEGG